jgi:hypothetical protein
MRDDLCWSGSWMKEETMKGKAVAVWVGHFAG